MRSRAAVSSLMVAVVVSPTATILSSETLSPAFSAGDFGLTTPMSGGLFSHQEPMQGAPG